MIKDRLRHVVLHIEVRDRQERHVQHIRRRQLARMVGLADQRCVNRTNRYTVQVFFTLRKLLTVIKLEVKLPACPLFHCFVNEFQAFRKRTALAPKRNTPRHLRAINHLRFRRASRRGNAKRKCKSTSRNRRCKILRRSSHMSVPPMDTVLQAKVVHKRIGLLHNQPFVITGLKRVCSGVVRNRR